MDAIADARRKNSMQSENAIPPKETKRPTHEKGNPPPPNEEEHSKAAHDVAELKDYV